MWEGSHGGSKASYWKCMRKIMDWKTGTGSRADFLHQLRPHVLSVDRFLNDDEQALADALLLPKLPCFLVPALPE
jgi:hypothetical protein